MRLRIADCGLRICLLAQLLVAALPFSASANNNIIIRIEVHDLTAAQPDEVLAVLPFKVGDEYSPTAIAEAENILRRWGLFTNVKIETEPNQAGVAVHIRLTEAHLIGEINLHHIYPYVDRRVRRYLTIRPGDPYNREAIEYQTTRLKDFFEREGYHNPEVTAKEEWQPYTSDSRVDFYIRKGTSYTIGRVTVRGNTVFPKGRFVSALNPWRTYTQRRLREAIAKLINLYRKKHYPKARIKLVEESLNPTFKEIDIVLQVEEGPHVNVRYMGNDHISNHDLTKSLTIFTEGRTDEFELEASAENIRKLYLRRGFPEAKVTARRDVATEGEINLIFTVSEGPHRRLNRVEFVGNESLGRGELRGQMLTQPISLFHKGAYNPEVLEEDTKVLKKHYESKGFLDANIATPDVTPSDDGKFLNAMIPVSEGTKYRIGEVRFEGNKHATHDELLGVVELRPGREADLSKLVTDKEAVRLFFADHGFPYAEIEQTVLRNDAINQPHSGGEGGTQQALPVGGATQAPVIDGGVSIVYGVNEEHHVRIGQILIVGDFITSQKAIRRAMSVKPGELYSEQKILESQLGIRRLGAFRAVSIETIGLKEGARVVPLRVRVEEEKPFVVDIDVGYSTDQKITGSLAFTNINSFGWAKRTQLRLTGGRRLSRGELAWIDPRFLGHDLTWTTNSWLQYEDKVAFNYMQAGGGFGLYRQYHRTGFSFRYSLERNYFLAGSSVAADAQSLRNSTISATGIGASFDTRNNFADPTKGIFLSGGTDFFNEIKGSGANFVQLHGGVSHYWQPVKGIVLAQFGRLAGIQTFGSGVSVPSNKLLFLGGDDTLRGFSEDSLGPTDGAGNAVGGRFRWIYNAELSAGLGRGLKAAVFFDIGSLTNSPDTVTKESIRETFGLGLRYMTPVGPIRADYGFKLDRRAGESPGRLHFTFGHIF